MMVLPVPGLAGGIVAQDRGRPKGRTRRLVPAGAPVVHCGGASARGTAMTTTRYVNPPGETVWRLATEQATAFRWEYDDGREALLQLYDKGKRQQWNAAERIDWSQSLHPDNPMQLPDETITICGSPEWNRLTEAQRNELRRHMQAWQVSQFLHGEQGALVCASRPSRGS
jgi:hypothetical protein